MATRTLSNPVLPFAETSNPSCSLCHLRTLASSVCIPTRSWRTAPPAFETALLIVGGAPGVAEDESGVAWSGRTGDLLGRLLDTAEIPSYADIYVTNAVRCLNTSDTVPLSCLKACRPYLLRDIRLLLRNYKRLFLLAMGAPAARTLTGIQLSALLQRQGIPYEFSFEDGSKFDIPIFSTYNPAILFPGRNPSLIHSVGDHLDFLAAVLSGRTPLPASLSPTPLPACRPPSGPEPSGAFPSLISLDIETYGILRGAPEQTAFNPNKSEAVDGVPIDKQIVTVCLSYPLQDLSSTQSPNAPLALRTHVFRWAKPRDRHFLYLWLKEARARRSTLIGKNIPFDLAYLRAADNLLRCVLEPPLRLDDIGLINYLDYELRQERSLKPLAMLFGAADYTPYLNAESVERRGASDSTYRLSFKAFGDSDPILWRYTATDAESVLRLYRWFRYHISHRYGPASSKLSTASADHRNLVLWTILNLNETGVCFDYDSLHHYWQRTLKLRDRLEAAANRYGLVLRGAGSEGTKRSYLQSLIKPHHLSSIQLTEKTRKFSVSSRNFKLLLRDYPNERALVLVLRHSDITKLINSYLEPLLSNVRKGICKTVMFHGRRIGIAYPSWHPVPFNLEKGGAEGTSGGTIQGRFSCRHPAVQTFPTAVSKHLCSRFKSGILLSADLSQIELRVAAWLSGDPVMLNAFANNADLHTQTARFLFDTDTPSKEQRHLAKRVNFLVLYRGGPSKLQSIYEAETGTSIPLEVCKSLIDRFYSIHSVFERWQNSLISEAANRGYLETITGWGRTFAGGTVSVNATYINEVCNFPIQCYATQLLQSAHFELLQRIRAAKLRTVIPIQVHDALVFDIPNESEKSAILQLISEVLPNPPLANLLADYTGRSVPIAYEVHNLIH